jgi:hypothetical protein
MKIFALCFSVTFVVISLSACGARSSDEQQVRELFASAETAAEERDASDVLAFVADDYEDADGLDKARLRDFLRGYFLVNPKLELLVTVKSLQFPADGIARAELTITRVSLSDPQQLHLAVELRRSGGDWRVKRADRIRG